MEAILGKIVEIRALGGGRYRVACVPACVLPGRDAVPREIAGAVLTVERETPDPRELGGPGDSFVLTPAESAPWLPAEAVCRLENAWAGIDITTRRAGGAMVAWREHGRAVDHFARPDDRIGDPLAHAGHADAFRTAWTAPRRIIRAQVTRVQAEGRRLRLTGLLPRRLHTELDCILHDDLPLLHWRRVFRALGLPRRRGPREPIDDIHSLGAGCCASWPAEGDGDTGSRVLTAGDGQLVSLRNAEAYQTVSSQGWRADGGWALVEHPMRRACHLYLFAPAHAPRLTVGLTPVALALTLAWPMAPVRTGGAVGLALGLAAGECCGVSGAGAWVGCRTAMPGGVRCAVIARLREPGPARLTLGGESRDAALHLLALPGVGDIACAWADFPGGALDAPLHIAVAGIAQREAA